MRNEIFELKMKGYCCSQIIMAMGLKRMGKDNEDLINAVAGLCNGMWRDKTCGILSGALCVLCLADFHEAGKTYIDEFTDWFEDSFGSAECSELLEGNPLLKAEKCPMMLEAAFTKLEELLEWDE